MNHPQMVFFWQQRETYLRRFSQRWQGLRKDREEAKERAFEDENIDDGMKS